MASSGNEIHVGDIGTVFEITMYDQEQLLTDLQYASEKCFVFKKPGALIIQRTAEFKTDGSDGILQYITVDGDLDLKGNWSIQGRVVLPTGKWSSDTERFKVYANLDPLPAVCP